MTRRRRSLRPHGVRRSGRGDPIACDEEGSVGLGAGTLNPGGTIERLVFGRHPVALTRTFQGTRDKESCFGAFDVELRVGAGFCNVNGGGMTAVVID